jgi:hypothetical protein
MLAPSPPPTDKREILRLAKAEYAEAAGRARRSLVDSKSMCRFGADGYNCGRCHRDDGRVRR